MSKVLLDTEALEIVRLAIEESYIDCGDAYVHFLEDLGKVIADHFGGELVKVEAPELEDEGFATWDKEYTLHFMHNENIPDGGGVYADFDKDMPIDEWTHDGEEDRRGEGR